MYQLISLVSIGVLVVCDQISKSLAIDHLRGAADISVWNGVLELSYSENFGIAWGMFQNSRWPVVILTGVMLLVFLAALMSGYYKKSKLITIGGILIVSGGIGNLIDRISLGYVVDFIHYYKWFDFPIFNVADTFITIGAVLVLVCFFFFTPSDPIKEKKQ